MIDSTNPRQLADNIRKLWDKFKSISGDLLPSRSTATTGQILKLTGENKTPSWADEYSYTPPAYSETEVNTGQKWIDNKDIYTKVFSGNFPEITQAGLYTIGNADIETVISLNGYISTSTANIYSPSFLSINRATRAVYFQSVSTTYSLGNYVANVYYTKPDPAPETRDDDTEEPEEVKESKTRKKTTK